MIIKKTSKNIIIIEKDEIKEHKCNWLNQKGDPCPWNSVLPENDYCKRHSIYEGIYKKEDISSLIKCSGCKNLFKPNTEQKQCDGCRKRAETIRKDDKQEKLEYIEMCKGLTQKGTNCTFEANEDDEYCEKHQNYKKWKELTDEGYNICRNWNRGCFEIINNDKKSCLKCRNMQNKNIILEDDVIINNKNIVIADIIEKDIVIKNTINNKIPDNLIIVETYNGHKVTMGKTAGTIYNPYYKVYDVNDIKKTHFYAMKCSDDSIFYFSEKSKNYIQGNTWFKMQNGYISTMIKKGDEKVGLYLHQLVAKTELGEGEEGKSVEHINRNKMDNRIENLRWATQSEQNSNTDKRSRKYNAKPLPEGLTHSDLPKYVVYYNEILNKETGRFREFFKIEKHPKLEKPWIGTKSNVVSIQDKLKAAKEKLKELDE
jgi:hypothetical protein